MSIARRRDLYLANLEADAETLGAILAEEKSADDRLTGRAKDDINPEAAA